MSPVTRAPRSASWRRRRCSAGAARSRPRSSTCAAGAGCARPRRRASRAGASRRSSAASRALRSRSRRRSTPSPACCSRPTWCSTSLLLVGRAAAAAARRAAHAAAAAGCRALVREALGPFLAWPALRRLGRALTIRRRARSRCRSPPGAGTCRRRTSWRCARRLARASSTPASSRRRCSSGGRWCSRGRAARTGRAGDPPYLLAGGPAEHRAGRAARLLGARALSDLRDGAAPLRPVGARRSGRSPACSCGCRARCVFLVPGAWCIARAPAAPRAGARRGRAAAAARPPRRARRAPLRSAARRRSSARLAALAATAVALCRCARFVARGSSSSSTACAGRRRRR